MYKLHFKITKSGLGGQKYLDARIMERASVIVFFQSIINKILIIFSLKKKKKKDEEEDLDTLRNANLIYSTALKIEI